MITEESESKFDILTSVRFTYTAEGRWHEVAVNCREFLSILKHGTIDDKPICAIEVMNVTHEDKGSVSYIYDFVLQAQGLNPWRMQ